MKYIKAQEFKDWITKTQPFVLDVRTYFEYQGGALEGALCIPIDTLQSRLDELPDKDTPILVYCAHGVRSVSAGSYLESKGFKNIFNLEGGLAALMRHQ